MQDENLGESLSESYRTHKRTVAVRNLGERTHLTLEQISKLVTHPDHGDIVKDITLQELLDVTSAKDEPEDEETDEEGTAAPTPKRKGGRKKTKKATKKKAKKAAKKKTAKKSAGDRKADYGKKKPRLDYDQGCKEIMAALKAHGGPAARSDLETATGYSGVQVRTFCKRLAENGKVKVLGRGGRSTRYSVA